MEKSRTHILKKELSKAKKVFSWNKSLFSIFGVNPVNSKNILHAFICLYLMLHLVLTILDLNRDSSDINTVLDIVTRLSAIIVIFVKFIVYKMKRQDLANILEEVLSDYQTERFETEEEIHTFVKYVSKARKYFKIIIPYTFCSVSLYFCRNLFMDGDGTVKDMTEYFLTYRITAHNLANNKNYLIVYIFAQLLGPLASFTLAADSGMIIAFQIHLCGRLYILSHCKLKNLAKNHKNFRRKVKDFVLQHNQVIRMSKKIDSMFSILMLQQMIYLTICICLVGYNTIMHWNQHEKKIMLVNAAGVTSTLFILFAYCYAGQCLMNESCKLTQALYNDTWYELKPEFMKYYIVLIKRTQKPLTLTGGGFCVYSYELFIAVCKSGMAYISILRATCEL